MNQAVVGLQHHHNMTIEDVNDDFDPSARQENIGNVIAAMHRIKHLENKVDKMQDSIRSLQEYAGLPEGYYYRLPYRWEGPPPNIYDRVFDQQPLVPAEDGPAGMMSWSWMKRSVPADGDSDFDGMESGRRSPAAADSSANINGEGSSKNQELQQSK